MVKASVVILNWNGEAMLRKYIPGLYESLKAVEVVPLAVPVAEGPVDAVTEKEEAAASDIPFEKTLEQEISGTETPEPEKPSAVRTVVNMDLGPSLFPELDIVSSVETEPDCEPEVSSEPSLETSSEPVAKTENKPAPESFEANLFSEIDPSFIGYPSQNEITAMLAEAKAKTKSRGRHSKSSSSNSDETKPKAVVREHRVVRPKAADIQDEPQMIDESETSEHESFANVESGQESQPEEVIMNVGLAELLRRKEEERAANIKARMESLRQRTMAVKEANRARKQLESKAYDAQYELVVADNGSTDGSIAWLKENYPDIRLIEFDKNYGFAGGYDKALQEIDAEYFVLLNSDVRVTPGWLDTLIDFLETHQRVAICMPKILKENDETIDVKKDSFEYAGACGGFIDRFGFPFCRGRVLKHTEIDENQYDTPMEVFWASGAAMCVRSSVWKELGGLDARFFAHMEEIDFCWRAKLMGHEVWAVPAAKVYHVGGGTLPNESPYKLYLNYRNNLLMLHKNLPPQGKEDLIFFRMLLDGASAAIYFLTGRKELYRSVLKAHKDFKEMRPDFEASPRAIVYSHIPFNKLYGVLNGSIVLSYFLGRRRFSDLRQFI